MLIIRQLVENLFRAVTIERFGFSPAIEAEVGKNISNNGFDVVYLIRIINKGWYLVSGGGEKLLVFLFLSLCGCCCLERFITRRECKKSCASPGRWTINSSSADPTK